jgi:hypothetical protein
MAGHIAEREQDVAAWHLGGDVPVAADPAVAGGRQVADHRPQARQVERALVQGQDGALQLKRHMPFLRQGGGERRGVSRVTGGTRGPQPYRSGNTADDLRLAGPTRLWVRW